MSSGDYETDVDASRGEALLDIYGCMLCYLAAPNKENKDKIKDATTIFERKGYWTGPYKIYDNIEAKLTKLENKNQEEWNKLLTNLNCLNGHMHKQYLKVYEEKYK
jgi:hypothetical protein